MTGRDGDGYTIIHRARGCLGVDSIQWDYPRPGLHRPLSPPAYPAADLPSAWFSEPDRNFLYVNTHLFVAPQSVLILCMPIISREKQSDIKYSIFGILQLSKTFLSFEILILYSNYIFPTLILPIYTDTIYRLIISTRNISSIKILYIHVQ